ncbi:hypothetical protein CNBH2410 [Cryptococcus deneoformans B-3501A]|uniref:hypothetical protein n=1 Tax=Cryptococcus deneoformans (strain B-3501A) TaxID=283643 RepID=UPI000042C72C|nr:hypothetical protein CNBH2410 [Cryptococcus neoformans var. neoformans B-3501A]EAL19142.1 hypothetical protein CNBH2410 [Cryptococcus neoformans var. neoformans B-3501A]
MRDNYNEHGVDEYYRKVAATYRNPFYPGIKKAVWALMNRWWEAEGRDMFSQEEKRGRKNLKVLDMAAGSGEGTLCLLEWARTGSTNASAEATSSASQPSLSVPDPLALLRSTAPSTSARQAFVPPNVRRPVVPPPKPTASAKVSSSGNQVFGSMIPARLPEGFEIDVIATDPYTSPAYTERTSRPCHSLSFTDLAQGLLPPTSAMTSPRSGDPNNSSEPIWDIIICSFALHLVTNPSELFALLFELSGKARWLIVVAPHKKPEIKETWGWARWDIASWTAAGEARLYGGGKLKGDGDDGETELEIVRDKHPKVPILIIPVAE